MIKYIITSYVLSVLSVSLLISSQFLAKSAYDIISEAQKGTHSYLDEYYSNYPSATVQGYKIKSCEFKDLDYPSDNPTYNFCNPKAMAVYKQYSKRDINFAKKYVLLQMKDHYFAALDPVTKVVFPLPFSIENFSTKNPRPKLQFSVNSNYLCTANNTFVNALTLDFRGGDAMPNTKYCIQFTDNQGFSGVADIVDIKTGKRISSF